jgi:hypothetical protein
MSQAAEAYTTPVVHLARAASEPVKQPRLHRYYCRKNGITYLPLERLKRENEQKRSEAREPTHSEIHGVLIACLVTGLTDRAKLALQARMQKMYDRAAGNAERQAAVKAAADCMYFTLKAAAR